MLNHWHPAVVKQVTIWNEAGKISALLDFGFGILGWTMGTLHNKICIKRCMFNKKDSKEPRLVQRILMYKMNMNFFMMKVDLVILS